MTDQNPFVQRHPAGLTTPGWVHDAVFYQIFPDRFARSERLEKPSHLEPWDSEPTPFGYKGGDLLGIVEHLDYLQDLGITALYLNPIFRSTSNHRYHTHDYYQVDPLLGGNEAVSLLLDECHRRGIRVVLDGVFNHASRGFFQFNDILENGAASPWLDWFIIHELPPNAYNHAAPPGYDAWVGLHALPKFNTDNPQVREYLMGVGEYWMRQGIDGWRLDVPAEITTPGFWEEFRQRVKAINPEAYLVGEVWEDARLWLQGDRFDGVMNYLFAEAAIAYATGRHMIRETVLGRSYAPWPAIDAETYGRKIDRLLRLYPWQAQLAQLNLLDSHDTSRLLSIAGGDVASVKLGALLLFTFPGAPSIYYGDEIGLSGALPDHRVRKTFPWDHPEAWNRELLEYYRELIALRKRHRALRVGAYQTLSAAGGTYVFARTLTDATLVIGVNAGETASTATIPSKSLSTSSLRPSRLFTTDNGAQATWSESVISLTLPARSGAVFEFGQGTHD
jgi:glycosidase